MINRKLIIDYLLRESKRNTEEILSRELEIKVIEDKVTCITGPRRAGKTYFIYKLREKFPKFLHINFENTAFKNISHEEVFEVLSLYLEIFGKKPEVLFLDEIQNLKNWETFVRTLLDYNEYKIFITGSSSKLLSREIATQLRGRSLTFILLPFSLREFLFAKGIEKKKFFTLEEEAKIKHSLKNYLLEGSYPEVVLKEEKERILSEYYTTILYNDFVERFELKNIELAKFIFDFFLQNHSQEFSVNKIANFLASSLKVGKNTIYKYVDKLPETLAVFFVEKYSKSAYQRSSWPKKAYICDLGLGNLVKFSEDYGRLMENSVFLELLRKKNRQPLLEIFYWKDYQGREVDFVVKEKQRVKQLLQVCYDPSDFKTKKRELKALVKASQELKCHNLQVITWDYEAQEEFKGKKIEFKPFWKFLLEK